MILKSNVTLQVTELRELPVTHITFSHIRIDAEKGLACNNAQRIAFENVEITLSQARL